jgi:serine/threonine protein kinase
MSLKSGGRLGAYEIVSAIGAGGMGEVYRARDTRLDRSVAIKILPTEFSTDARLKLRFEREAKTISQLNHPNICTVYDVGHDSGVDYLVMELIDGESLADRIARGPMPLADVIRFGTEVAEALEKAHRHGVVHRDLKPGNIMITKSGAKLLDFGLARSSLSSPHGHEASATQQKPITEEGMIVGTYRYMSPEQLGGDPVDHRSDIFALGAVLYEMVTGRRAFDGKSRTSVVAAIVAGDPPSISAVRPLTPAVLDRLIGACLAKDPDARLQSAHDVAVELRWVAESGNDAISKETRSNWLAWSIAAAFAIATAAVTLFHLVAPKPIVSPVRFTIPAPPGTALQGIPAVSPDGRSIIFRAGVLDGPFKLWIRSLDSFDAKPLNGTEGASHVFWSPDGKHIGFVAARKLWRMDLEDGSTHALYGPLESIPGGATWNDHDVILFAQRAEGQLYKIAASGGEAVRLTKDDSKEVWPWFLPDGDHFLFCTLKGIMVGSLSSGERKVLITVKDIAPVRAIYASGYILYNNFGALYAQKFDVDKLELVGSPQKIEDEIENYSPGRAAFSVSPGGVLVYHTAGAPMVAQLVFVDRAGHELANVGPVAAYSDFRISPDDRRIAFMKWETEAAAWILDAGRGASTRVTFERFAGFPVWLPDNRGIVYAAVIDRPPNLILRHDDGTTEVLTHSTLQHYPTSVTPDGKLVIAEVFDPANDLDLFAVPVAAPHTPIPLAHSQFRERDGQVSPDGKWLAFTSDDSGRMQVYAMPMPAGPRVQLSTGAGRTPRWSRDARHLYYVDHTQRMVMDVPIAVEDGELRPTTAVPLFPYKGLDFDVTRDGRFLVAKEMLNPDSPPMTVVLNWTAALK